jgi:hypothetical protein
MILPDINISATILNYDFLKLQQGLMCSKEEVNQSMNKYLYQTNNML